MKSPNISLQATELNPSCRSKLNPKGLVLVMGIKAWNLDVFPQYSVSPLIFGHWPAQTLNLQDC